MLDVQEYQAVKKLLSVQDKQNTELAFQLLESIGFESVDKELAMLLTNHPEAFSRSAKNQWKLVLELVEELSFNHESLMALPPEITWMKQLTQLTLNNNYLSDRCI